MLRIAVLMAGTLMLAAPAAAQDDPAQGLPGSVFVLPPQIEKQVQTADPEKSTDMQLFLARGYSEPDWDSYSSLVRKVADDLVVPDYVKRTGLPAPDSPSIEIASAQITKMGFNDLIVRSRLPGDCDASGCLTQIYQMVGKTWFKKLEFKAYGVAFKNGDDPETTLVAAVGGDDVGSRIIVWNGTAFSQ